jgi:hypothetical protein
MRVVAWDTETDAFRPGLQAPPMVCLQWAEVTPAGVGVATVVNERDALALLECWLDPANDVHLVGAEVAYDVLAAVTSATDGEFGSPERGHALMKAFVAAYDRDRVSDVLLRQQLIDLARGCYEYEQNDNGETVGHNDYNLKSLAWRLCGLELSKGEDTFRKRYHELRGIPIIQWPPEAVTYAANDVTATGSIWLAQWRPSARIAVNFPGKTIADAVADEPNQARAALWIKAMSVYGLKTDPIALGIFRTYVAADYAETVNTLVSGCKHCGAQPEDHVNHMCGDGHYYEVAGLARRDFHVSRPAVLAYITARPHLHPLCVKYHKDKPPTITLGGAQRAALAAADPALACLVEPSTNFPEASAAGLVTASEHRNTKIAKERMIAFHRARGSVPNLTKAGLKLLKESKRKGYDGPAIDPWDYVALDKDACASTGDHLLEAYAEMTSLAKILSTDLPRLERGVLEPIHSHFTVLRETGRTSSSAPNVQNQARGRKDRIGARECFVPRVGRVLIDADYSMLELHTLAQACLWMLGYSTLADELRKPGSDPHTKVGASIHGVTYEVGLQLYEEGDPDFVNARNCAKPLNFGKPGGLGAETMMSFAAKGYGVKRPLEFWQRAIKVWNETWVEMPAYFDAISALEGRRGTYNIVQPWSGRLRAGATYCSACNSVFQGLGADVAKLAGWLVFKAQYVDTASPLFGARTVLFVHDQIIAEVNDDANAPAAAAELGRLMNLAGKIVCPDVPPKTKPILARRYSKMAKKALDANGNLTAWEDVRVLQAA